MSLTSQKCPYIPLLPVPFLQLTPPIVFTSIIINVFLYFSWKCTQMQSCGLYSRSIVHVCKIHLCACLLEYFISFHCCTLWEYRRRQWHPTLVLLPGKSHGWRSLVGCDLAAVGIYHGLFIQAFIDEHLDDMKKLSYPSSAAHMYTFLFGIYA